MSKQTCRLCYCLLEPNGSNALRQFVLVIFFAAVVLTLVNCASTDLATEGATGLSAAEQLNAEYEADKERAFTLFYDEKT